METKTPQGYIEESNAILEQAKAIIGAPTAGAEDMAKARKMVEEAKGLRERATALSELEALAGQLLPQARAAVAGGRKQLDTFGKFLSAVWHQQHKARPHSELQVWASSDEPETKEGVSGWVETKDLVENVGASGGFVVFPEYLPRLFQMEPGEFYVRQRATVMPMRARTLTMPVLDQTGTTAGQSHFYGGVLALWTEEGQYKDESDPKFRQMQLVAHKLVTYTEASDELLADSAIGLEALLTALFGGAIRNEEEWAFINGTGAGQPLGVANAGCGATIAVPRAVAGAITLPDIFNMLTAFTGQSPIWLAHQSAMPQLLGLNGPAGNPSYVWIGNGRDRMPTTLMGYPIYFVENCPTLGARGDIILADWSKYVIGDRQSVTIDSSKHYRFKYDLTSWRGVHRVDGRPWLSAPITYRDGATQVSPFVVLDAGRQS